MGMKLPSHVDPTGLKIDFLNEPKGCDNPVKTGDIIIIDFAGFFEDGTPLPVAGKGTYEFQVGITDVIHGWHLGVQGMCLGESRKLTIPSDLAYGDKGSGNPGDVPIIPGGSTLVFDIYLKSVVDAFAESKYEVPIKDGKIDEQGLLVTMIEFFKDQLTKNRRG